MKFVIILLAFVAFATGDELREALAAKERSISSQIVDAIEAAKLQMPCGFPGLGVPPMAPLKLEHKEIKTQGDSMDLQAIFDKIRVYGLNEFDVQDFKISVLLSKITFKFNWRKAYAKAIYDVLLKVHDSNLLSKLMRKGNAKIAIEDLLIWGTAKYSTGAISGGGIRLKEFKLYVKIGSVKSEIENISNIGIVNRKINEIIEETIQLAINGNTDNVARLSNEFGVPIINGLIGDRSLSDLLGMIGGGGGGGSEEKEECIPPTEED